MRMQASTLARTRRTTTSALSECHRDLFAWRAGIQRITRAASVMLTVACHGNSFHSDSSSGDFYDCDSNAGSLRRGSNNNDAIEGNTGPLSTLLAEASVRDGAAKGPEFSSSALAWVRCAAVTMSRK